MAKTLFPKHIERPQQMEKAFETGSRNLGKTETTVVDTLAELYDLLNDFSPLWYTQEHKERAETALRLLGRM